jgi:hypothetical protein
LFSINRKTYLPARKILLFFFPGIQDQQIVSAPLSYQQMNIVHSNRHELYSKVKKTREIEEQTNMNMNVQNRKTNNYEYECSIFPAFFFLGNDKPTR